MTGLASQALAFHRALAARRVKDAAGTAIGRLSLTRRDACAISSGRRSCGGLFVLGIGIFPYPAIFSLFKLYLGLDFLFAGFFIVALSIQSLHNLVYGLFTFSSLIQLP